MSDSIGCDSTYTANVVVYENPYPKFITNSPVCQGTNTCITDQSLSDTTNNCFGNSLDSWDWNISYHSMEDSNGYQPYYGNILDTTTNNSNISFCEILEPPCDTNTISFRYEVTLILKDTYGCVDTFTKKTTVLCKPEADFDSTGVCIGLPDGGEKKFFNLSKPKNGMNWQWNIPSSSGNIITLN